jgi:hypothetical protein
VRNRRLLSVSSSAFCAAVVLMVLAGCTPATSTQLSKWEMNEPAGSRTMTDSSPTKMNGTVGSAVQTGYVSSGRTGYNFPWPGLVPRTVNRNKLVVVNDSRLNPGAGDFVIATTFSHWVTGTNVLQKGQAGLPGGYYKIETHEGHVTCFFEGSTGVISSVVSPKTYNDKAFHTYRCERKAAFGVRLTIDNVVVGTNPKQPGTIANNSPFVIGGKYYCDQTTVECDYFSGVIDRVAVATV